MDQLAAMMSTGQVRDETGMVQAGTTVDEDIMLATVQESAMMQIRNANKKNRGTKNSTDVDVENDRAYNSLP